MTVLVVYLIPDSFPILKDIFLKFLNTDGHEGRPKSGALLSVGLLSFEAG